MTATKGKIGVLIEEHFDATEYRRFNEYFPAQGYEVEYLSHLAVGAYLLLYLILSVPLAAVYNFLGRPTSTATTTHVQPRGSSPC